MSESGGFKKKLEMFSKNLPENQHNIGRKKTVPERKVKEVGTASEDKLKENPNYFFKNTGFLDIILDLVNTNNNTNPEVIEDL